MKKYVIVIIQLVLIALMFFYAIIQKLEADEQHTRAEYAMEEAQKILRVAQDEKREFFLRTKKMQGTGFIKGPDEEIGFVAYLNPYQTRNSQPETRSFNQTNEQNTPSIRSTH